jgi:glycerophosphoryl diester phosphodiesterase
LNLRLTEWAPPCEVPFFMRLLTIFFPLIISLGAFAQSFQDMDSTLVAGHRCGFYSLFPENSIEMVKHVLRNTNGKLVVLEFDVRRSKDGTMYVLHDETLDRTTNGIGYIKELPDSAIDAVRLKSSNGDLTLSTVLTLSAWLDSLKSQNCFFMFDVKDCNLKELVDLITEKNIEKRSLLLLFSSERLIEFEREKSTIAFSYLVENETSWLSLKNAELSKTKFAYITKNTPLELIVKMKSSGIKVLSDVSESQRNNGNYYPSKFYKQLVVERMLDIVVTDFPIEVEKYLRE